MLEVANTLPSAANVSVADVIAWWHTIRLLTVSRLKKNSAKFRYCVIWFVAASYVARSASPSWLLKTQFWEQHHFQFELVISESPNLYQTTVLHFVEFFHL